MEVYALTKRAATSLLSPSLLETLWQLLQARFSVGRLSTGSQLYCNQADTRQYEVDNPPPPKP